MPGIVRLTASTTISGITTFTTPMVQPVTGKFILEFDDTIPANLDTETEFAQGSSPGIPMLTFDGGYVRTDMIRNSIQLRKYGVYPIVQCNPYRFRAIKKYDPDRIVFCDALPQSAFIETPPSPSNSTPPATPAGQSSVVQASVASPVLL